MGILDCNELQFVIRCGGSVIPKGLLWAAPCSCAAFGLHKLADSMGIGHNMVTQNAQFWANFTYILGILLVFRTNQAYSRYWEGATLLQQVRGEWFQAISSIFAFCTKQSEKQEQVEAFQHLLVRLVSMLYCTALHKIALIPVEKFETISTEGIDKESLAFLAANDEQCEILIQWVQRLIMENYNQGVITAPAPILSRVFQELSRGFVNAENVRKIAEVPFPFPYTQMIIVLLLAVTFLTPVLASITCHTSWEAGFLTFIPVLTFWCLNYMAAEIEQPFGEDANDLPIPEMVQAMNLSLTKLVHRRTQCPPTFYYDKKKHSVCNCTTLDSSFASASMGPEAQHFAADFCKRRSPSPSPRLRSKASADVGAGAQGRRAARSGTAPPSPGSSRDSAGPAYGSRLLVPSSVPVLAMLPGTEEGSDRTPSPADSRSLPDSQRPSLRHELWELTPGEAENQLERDLEAMEAAEVGSSGYTRWRPPAGGPSSGQTPGWQAVVAEPARGRQAAGGAGGGRTPPPKMGMQVGHLRLGNSLAARPSTSAKAARLSAERPQASCRQGAGGAGGAIGIEAVRPSGGPGPPWRPLGPGDPEDGLHDG